MLLFFSFQLYLHLSFSVGWIFRSWMARSKGVYLKLIDNVNLFLCWIVSFSSKHTLPFTTLLGTPGGLPPWRLLSAVSLPTNFQSGSLWETPAPDGRAGERSSGLVRQWLHSFSRSLFGNSSAVATAPSSCRFRPGGNHFLQLPVFGCFANPDTFPQPLHLYK